MTDAFEQQRRALNQCRFTHHDQGHYESYFLRANHPAGRWRSGFATPFLHHAVMPVAISVSCG